MQTGSVLYIEKKDKMGSCDAGRFEYQLKMYSMSTVKFNLFGSDDPNYYWHDLCKNAGEIEWVLNCCDGVMVWGASC